MDTNAQQILATLAQLNHPSRTWKPRPDQPARFDEQTSFVQDTEHRNIVCLGGTGSGKSDAAAKKVTDILRFKEPPRPQTPYWVLSDTFDMSCGILWAEKLAKFIPKDMIDGEPSWLDKKKCWPKSVRLRPWTSGNSWTLEFKSAAQGRERLQGASIGGCWCSESIADWSVIEEIQGRMRDYSWAQLIWDLTPLIPMPDLEELYEEQQRGSPKNGWWFYHLNSELNAALADGWVDEFLDGLSPDVRETRRIGKFGSYEGVIFKEFNKEHIVKPFKIPEEWPRWRSLDFGNNFACIWLALDPDTQRQFVYREYYWDYAKHRSARLLKEHAECILGEYWGYEGCRCTYYDPADPTSAREIQQHGVADLTPARKNTLESIEEIRKKLCVQSDGKPGLFFFDSCRDSIHQMRAYRWEKQRGEKDPKPQPIKHMDHLVDAVRYAVFSRIVNTGPFKPIQRVERTWGSKASGSRPAGPAYSPMGFRPLGWEPPYSY